MTFEYEGWTLYTREAEFRDGAIKTVYFFSKRIPPSGRECDLPKGYEVYVNKRLGMPYIKKE